VLVLVLVLAAAFAIASLLMLAAVSSRAREFGILKALGWRSRRVGAQVLGESVVVGIVGSRAGFGLGFVGVAVIAAVAPRVYATADESGLNKAGHPPPARGPRPAAMRSWSAAGKRDDGQCTGGPQGFGSSSSEGTYGQQLCLISG
jgi:ABC-type antimicrobial peptide transport system permease subunit